MSDLLPTKVQQNVKDRLLLPPDQLHGTPKEITQGTPSHLGVNNTAPPYW